MKKILINLIGRLYKNPFLEAMIPTQVYFLRKNLEDCATILDLGCGPSSSLQHCGPFKETTGVEAYAPYIEKARERKTHTHLICGKIEDLSFKDKSFDAVLMLEVIEHMTEAQALQALEKAERWARKKVIITTPNGFISQKSLDGNPLQEHLSGWSVDTMKKLGYKSRGLAGVKFLRQEVQGETMDTADITVSIKYRPRFFWFAVSALSQIFIHRTPKLAFELFAVKKLPN